ncbi:hypothetical protein TNCV_5122531 [Trichonephila clavipes]|nr:hypothetical protein TNCV_5122531 [Trichonephila clavipes]
MSSNGIVGSLVVGASDSRPEDLEDLQADKDYVKEHLGWGIAAGLVNGTPVGKQEKGQFLVSVLLITGYQEREAVQDGSIEPLYHAVRLRMQSSCPGFFDGEYFTQSLANCRIEVSPLIGVQL